MTTQSYTGTINTDGEFESVTTLTGITFTSGNKYTLCIQNNAFIKIADAIFPVADEKFEYTAGDDALYIQTTYKSCILTVLENS